MLIVGDISYQDSEEIVHIKQYAINPTVKLSKSLGNFMNCREGRVLGNTIREGGR